MPHIFCYATTSLTVGRLYLLLIYTAIITFSLTLVNAPTFSQHFLDDIAFRAAWVTVTQIPLVYLLSAKRGPMDLLTGLSYERVNWMHRWVGRILFVSGTVHMAIMKSSISVQDIMQSHNEGMSVVRHGIGAYCMLGWITASSILPLRHWSYRAFYINHWISSIAFLALVFRHVPGFAQTPIFIALSFLTLDKTLQAYSFCNNNISVLRLKRKFARFGRGPGSRMLVTGYPVEMTAPPPSIAGLSSLTKESTTTIRIQKIPFSWKPGQHIRLFIPALGAFEIHPFTPANCSALLPPPLPPRKDIEQVRSNGLLASHPPNPTSEMLLMIRAHSGLTYRLAKYYAEWLTRPCPNASEPSSTLTAYIDGPYGETPMWSKYEKLMLVATSTGISFTLSILDHLEQLCFLEDEKLKTRSVTFVWVIRHSDPQFEHVVEGLLSRYSTLFYESDIRLEAEFYTTCPHSAVESVSISHDPFAHLRRYPQERLSGKPPLRIRNPDEIYDEWDREAEIRRLGQTLVDPFVTEVGSGERNSSESDQISDTSTFVEDHGDDAYDENPFSDAYELGREDASYRPLPPPQSWQHEPLKTKRDEEELGCRCSLIQHGKKKLPSKTMLNDFISRRYAIRPDLSVILSKAVPRACMESTMVAVCANRNVSRDVRKAVAKMNVEFAMRRRPSGVEIFSEGFA